MQSLCDLETVRRSGWRAVGPWERARRAATGATIASFDFDFLDPTFQFLAFLLLAHQLLLK
jgi:hypothetical protein